MVFEVQLVVFAVKVTSAASKPKFVNAAAVVVPPVPPCPIANVPDMLVKAVVLLSQELDSIQFVPSYINKTIAPAVHEDAAEVDGAVVPYLIIDF